MISISRVDPHEYDAATTVRVAPSHGVPSDQPGGAPGAGDTDGGAWPAGSEEAVRRVVADATAADGRSPLNEATLLALRHHGLRGHALWLASEAGAGDPVGLALATPAPGATGPGGATGPVEVNLVVSPAARGRGVGRALAEAALDAVGPAEVSAWSHGNHPAAERLASRLGFDRARDLWVMRRPLSPEHPLPALASGAGGVDVRTFVPGQDEDAFLAVNAEAFAGHPEQAAMTRADLAQRMAEEWFDADGFFLAEPADAPVRADSNEAVESPSLLGFHWTKAHDDRVGEVYVIGVSPAAQGQGLGRLLTLTGLHHLRERGLHEVILYVEADNAAAVAVYQGLGFNHDEADTDVMYLRTPRP